MKSYHYLFLMVGGAFTPHTHHQHALDVLQQHGYRLAHTIPQISESSYRITYVFELEIGIHAASASDILSQKEFDAVIKSA